MGLMDLYAVVGHFCPTDANPEDVDGTLGTLDEHVSCEEG
jgi:hypothetical protein